MNEEEKNNHGENLKLLGSALGQFCKKEAQLLAKNTSQFCRACAKIIASAAVKAAKFCVWAYNAVAPWVARAFVALCKALKIISIFIALHSVKLAKLIWAGTKLAAVKALPFAKLLGRQVKSEFLRFLLMLSTFTGLTIPLEFQPTQRDYGRGLVYLPIVGAAVGSACALVFHGASLYVDPLLASVAAVVVHTMLMGARQFTGLHGEHGTISACCMLMFNGAALHAIGPDAVVAVFLMPICSALAVVFICGLSAEARDEGQTMPYDLHMVEHCGLVQMLAALVITSALGVAMLGMSFFALVGSTLASSLGALLFSSAKVKGSKDRVYIKTSFIRSVSAINNAVFLAFFIFLQNTNLADFLSHSLS